MAMTSTVSVASRDQAHRRLESPLSILSVLVRLSAEIWSFLHRPRDGEWSDESGRSGCLRPHGGDGWILYHNQLCKDEGYCTV